MNQIQILSINQESNGTQSVIDYSNASIDWQLLYSEIQALGIRSYVKIATCNRVEIYYEADQDYSQSILDKWSQSVTIDRRLALSEITVISGTLASVKYIIDLSAGLKSVVLGDSQILSQIKKAFEEARSENRLKSLLERTYQWVMKTHKRICNETKYNDNSVSVAYHSLKHISRTQSTSKRLLIIGAGRMAIEVLKYLNKFQFDSISITNRTSIKAVVLAHTYNLTVLNYGPIDCLDYDFIISCTDNGYELLGNIEGLRHYVDLSISSAQIKHLPVPFLPLKEVQELINQKKQKQLACLDNVKHIIEDQVSNFNLWLANWTIRKNIHLKKMNPSRCTSLCA